MIKIYATSIPRFQDRHLHIKRELASKTELPWEVVGVDGLTMRKQEAFWPHNMKLRDSEVGCALSHAEACRKVVEDRVDYALIIEDDVILPSNIDDILITLSSVAIKGGVISLYNRTILPEKFSALDSQRVLSMNVVYPMESRFMRTAAAYFLDREAAGNIARFNIPVRVVADNWASYYQSRSISSIRLLHPIPVSLHPFSSTLSVDRGTKFQINAIRFLKRIPGFGWIRKIRLQRIERKRERHLVFIDARSDQVRNVA